MILNVTIRKSCGARPDIYGLTCTLTSSNHAISEYLLLNSLPDDGNVMK